MNRRGTETDRWRMLKKQRIWRETERQLQRQRDREKDDYIKKVKSVLAILNMKKRTNTYVLI